MAEDHSFGHDAVMPGELEDHDDLHLGPAEQELLLGSMKFVPPLEGRYALIQRARMRAEIDKLQSSNARLQRGFNILRLHLQSLEDMCERLGQGGEA